jgi:Ca2+:H+ antiporter
MNTRSAFGRIRPYLIPGLSLALLIGTLGHHITGPTIAIVLAALVAAVLTAVHHAEVLAERLGEALGALLLALAVTVIESSLIITLMVTHHGTSSAVARDTVFAALMIVVNGVVGLSLLMNGWRNGVVHFRQSGTSALLATLIALATLSLVLPTFTRSGQGQSFSNSQLIFAAVSSTVVYGVFVFVQTIRHREDFAPELNGDPADLENDDERPTRLDGARSGILLLISLVAVVGLAEVLSGPLEHEITVIGAPQATVGLIIALLVLLPEALSALKAARRNRMQTSLNLSLGSAIASIGLTIPTVAVASLILHQNLVLGLGPQEIVLLAVTSVLASITLGQGEATILQGAIHVMIFSAFVFFAISP